MRYIIIVLNIDCIWDSGKSIICRGIDNSKNKKKKKYWKETWNDCLSNWRRAFAKGCLGTMKTVTWSLEANYLESWKKLRVTWMFVTWREKYLLLDIQRFETYDHLDTLEKYNWKDILKIDCYLYHWKSKRHTKKKRSLKEDWLSWNKELGMFFQELIRKQKISRGKPHMWKGNILYMEK